MFKLYNTYNCVKDIFARPACKFYCGLWINSPGVPYHRSGNTIKLGKYYRDFEYNANTYSFKWTPSFKVRHKFISKLFKPVYTLPLFLTFNIFNYDVFCKYEFDKICFEANPQLTIVMFGIAFTWILCSPVNGTDKEYWESIEHYMQDKDITTVDDCMKRHAVPPKEKEDKNA